MEVLSYKDEELEVLFLDGSHCKYFDVPETVFAQLTASEDPLRYFNENIWCNKYEHEMQWESLEALLSEIADILLVEPPISVNERPIDDTPLHVAAVWGDVRAVEMLLENGAKVNVPGDLSCMPIYNAIAFDHWRCARRLLAAGASLDDENELNTSARTRALASTNESVRALAKKVPKQAFNFVRFSSLGRLALLSACYPNRSGNSLGSVGVPLGSVAPSFPTLVANAFGHPRRLFMAICGGAHDQLVDKQVQAPALRVRQLQAQGVWHPVFHLDRVPDVPAGRY